MNAILLLFSANFLPLCLLLSNSDRGWEYGNVLSSNLLYRSFFLISFIELSFTIISTLDMNNQFEHIKRIMLQFYIHFIDKHTYCCFYRDRSMDDSHGNTQIFMQPLSFLPQKNKTPFFYKVLKSKAHCSSCPHFSPCYWIKASKIPEREKKAR